MRYEQSIHLLLALQTSLLILGANSIAGIQLTSFVSIANKWECLMSQDHYVIYVRERLHSAEMIYWQVVFFPGPRRVEKLQK